MNLFFKYTVQKVFTFIALITTLILATSCEQKETYTPLQIALKNHKHDEGFIGSAKCATCHKSEYKDWSNSYHKLAMQLPTDKTVLGDFNNTSYTIYGVTSKFFKKDSLFYVNTEGPDGKYHNFQVKYTFGYYPLQQYLVIFPKGKLQVLTPFWDNRPKEKGGQKWQHLYPDEFIASHDELNWGRALQNWNYMCAECHSTNVKKGFDPKTATYNTTFDEINVSCEACHGPGDLHYKWAQNPSQKLKNKGFVFDIIDRDTAQFNINPKSGLVTRSHKRTSQMQVEWCGRCHSRRTQLTDEYIYGKVLENSHMVSTLDYPLYNDDGTNNDEDYVYGSFTQSKMYQKGVTCKNCHNVHSTKLKAPKNNVCFQCHMPSIYNTPKHHKHKENSSGASCINCHMPKITVMVVDPRSDHSLRIPRPDISLKTGAKNACINCHKDKSNEWAYDNFKNWYGSKYDTIAHYGIAFHNARTKPNDSQTLLNDVISNKNTSDIVLGTAIKYQNYTTNPLAFKNLKVALKSKSALVRRSALESLKSLPKETQQKYALSLAKDSVKSVQHVANSIIFDMPTENLTEDQQKLIYNAKVAYIKQLLYWQDRSLGLSSLGVAAMSLNKLDQAENYFKRAIETDTLNLIAKINYADLKRVQGDNNASIRLLQNALKINDSLSIAYQALAFAFIRNNNKDKALTTLKTAITKGSQDPQNFYYYAIMLNDMGKPEEALRILNKAIKKFDTNENLLVLFYSINRDLNNSASAKETLNKLIKLFPNNAQYQQMKASH